MILYFFLPFTSLIIISTCSLQSKCGEIYFKKIVSGCSPWFSDVLIVIYKVRLALPFIMTEDLFCISIIVDGQIIPDILSSSCT